MLLPSPEDGAGANASSNPTHRRSRGIEAASLSAPQQPARLAFSERVFLAAWSSSEPISSDDTARRPRPKIPHSAQPRDWVSPSTMGSAKSIHRPTRGAAAVPSLSPLPPPSAAFWARRRRLVAAGGTVGVGGPRLNRSSSSPEYRSRKIRVLGFEKSAPQGVRARVPARCCVSGSATLARSVTSIRLVDFRLSHTPWANAGLVRLCACSSSAGAGLTSAGLPTGARCSPWQGRRRGDGPPSPHRRRSSQQLR
ncbi:hypothetical protein THAOC_34703 [Thalassiosira oceanica]|uniref:Uncharacterized protein n=1 Tax=Thalassiosira oceanica TaxID=159749 RepID=K0RIW2_THAOC|nr:hypothetical protein THAOC_34703 [Thalassiosira oceanica]|eukprot:EJK46622.1 hypothetical protein THAOC_34703 [Thalassiosira oceanica]